MKVAFVIVENEKIAIVRKTQRQLERQIKNCYLEKYPDILIERVK